MLRKYAFLGEAISHCDVTFKPCLLPFDSLSLPSRKDFQILERALNKMEAVSGIFAVLSLGIQVAESARKIHSLFKGVRHAPEELIKLARTVDQFCSVLNEASLVVGQCRQLQNLPSSVVLVENALQEWRADVERLVSCVDAFHTKLVHSKSPQRLWAAVRIFAGRDDLEQLRCSLFKDITLLQTALAINSSRFQWVILLYA